MREYVNKKNRQKQAYFSDRFYVAPSLEKKEVFSDEIFLKDFNFLKTKLEINKTYIEHTHLVLEVNKDDIFLCAKLLKEELEFDMLMELSAIDYLEKQNGFEIFYEFLSMIKHKRLRLKTFIKKDEELFSLSSLFSSANWSEREMFDMFGIKIINHPNLKRLIMPDDWYGHPLLKSYPLQGDEAASWYEVDKIFGKENRDKIGPEQRDSANIDRYDTKRFARLGHEVDFGQDVKKEKPNDISYQEENPAFVMKKFKNENSTVLKRRK